MGIIKNLFGTGLTEEEKLSRQKKKEIEKKRRENAKQAQVQKKENEKKRREAARREEQKIKEKQAKKKELEATKEKNKVAKIEAKKAKKEQNTKTKSEKITTPDGMNQKEAYRIQKEEKKKQNAIKRQEEEARKEKEHQEERVRQIEIQHQEEKKRRVELEKQRVEKEARLAEKNNAKKEKEVEAPINMFGFEIDTLERGKEIQVEIIDETNEYYIVTSLVNHQDAILPKIEIENEKYEVGDELDVLVFKMYAGEFYVSRRRFLNKIQREEAMSQVDHEELLKGKVVSYREPFFNVNLDNGLVGKVFVGNMDLKFVEDPKKYIDNEYEFVIKEKLDDKRVQLELDRTKVLKQAQNQLMDNYKIGATITVNEYEFNKGGIEFNTSDGVRGFIPNREIDHTFFNSQEEAKELITLPFDCEITEIQNNHKSSQLLCSRKMLIKNPWEVAKETFSVGDVITKPIAHKENFGMFLQLVPGIRGFAHNSEYSTEIATRIKEFKIGDEVKAKIIEIDDEKKQINLTLNLNREQEDLEFEKLNEEQVIEIDNYAFNKGGLSFIYKGIKGFVPVSEFSYKFYQKPEDAKGDIKTPFSAKIIELKTENRKEIVASIKAITPEPWEQFINNHQVDDIIEAKFVNNADFGTFVEIIPGVRGLIHKNNYVNGTNDLVSTLKENDLLTVRIIQIDEEEKRIDLSMVLDQESHQE